ncbi:MAG: 2-octaprenyl-6-methoxyphenyl hydroxylase [Wenzhouxiangellaceae bacterium]
MNRFDVTIVGGGLVGVTLALALRDSGLRIAMIEAVDRKADTQPSYDDRTLVLNRVSCEWLRVAGLWGDLSDAATPIRRIHVSAQGRFGQTRLRAENHAVDAFGHVLQARRLGAAMLAALSTMDEVTQYCPDTLTDLRHTDDGIQLSLKNSEQGLSTRLLIGADGAASRVRELCGLSAHTLDYQQTAIISNVSAERGHDGCAYERFTSSGPLALLPHGPGRMGLVWSVPLAEAEARLAQDDADFLRDLQQHYGYRLGRFTRLGKRFSYPLKLVHVQQPLAPRTVLIGNAAHTIHPVSAQGFNLGLRDALVLAGELRQAAAEQADPGASERLQAYQSRRDGDQLGTIRYTDGLVRLYRHPASLMRGLGSAALLAHQWLMPLQRQLVRQAMGYRVSL